ncbi:MAG: DTW domain-containing protein [Myxococcota bacterium]
MVEAPEPEALLRGVRQARCIGCRAALEACVCDVLRPVAAPFTLYVRMHPNEAYRTTNTGYLAAKALGGRVRTDDATVPEGALVLQPGGRPLEASDAGATLVVVDGAWRQARRLSRRLLVRGHRAVGLPPGPPSRYVLRTGPTPAHLSTLEAVARACAAVGDAEASRALEALHDAFVRRDQEPTP